VRLTADWLVQSSACLSSKDKHARAPCCAAAHCLLLPVRWLRWTTLMAWHAVRASCAPCARCAGEWLPLHTRRRVLAQAP